MLEEIVKKEDTEEIDIENNEQIERGKRIKKIREELNMTKTQLATEIGTSGQFLGTVEEGKGKLAFRCIKKLMEISGHSADYILYGLDDNIIGDTKKILKKYNEDEIIKAMNVLKDIAIFIKEN